MNPLRRLPPGSGRWLLLFAIVIPFAVMRIARSLQSDEEQIVSRIEYVLEGLEARKPRRISRFLTRDFTDAATGYGRSDVAQWTRGLLVPGERYRATLSGGGDDEEPGIEILEISGPEVTPRTARVTVRCLIERRHKTTEFKPWWDLEFTGEMVRDGGVWKLQRTDEVNHETRPRR